VSEERVRQRLEVRGVVQGVGFRPFVYVTASALSLSGSVANNTGGVVIEVEGDSGAVGQFVVRLREQAPPLAVIESIRSVDLPVIGGTGFTIAESQQHGGVHTLVSADVASCADCRREVADPGDRRYRHPFITCTNCGPRFSIITGLPYDRPATTMAGFVMCPACEREYHDPSDRRFHAQPIACHDCGPRLSLVLPGQDRPRAGEQALAGARALLAAGRILAVKGLGGYHLACDAGNWAAKRAGQQAVRGDGARPGDRG
jgi:hydrogenase maturation protein HypF